MKSREEKFAIYIIENKSTIRGCAKVFGFSKSTVHNDLSKKLKKTNKFLYYQVYRVLEQNLKERHFRGGNATRLKYLNRRICDWLYTIQSLNNYLIKGKIKAI